MIRFSISGEYLDLPADFSLQFKKSNVLFAFDNMECERSTSFDIPVPGACIHFASLKIRSFCGACARFAKPRDR